MNNQRAAFIREALKTRGMKQTELQELLGITWQTMSTWTNGHASVDWSRWMSICLALGIPQTWAPPESAIPPPRENTKRVRAIKDEAKEGETPAGGTASPFAREPPKV
jgi:transcriptional regulator with XRE-family HTH domain